MVWVYTSIDKDGDEARRRAARWIGTVDASDGSRFASLVDRVAAAGTVDEVTSRLQAMIDADARHLLLAPCADEIEQAQKQLSDDVVPALYIR